MSASPADRTPGRTPNGVNVPPPRRLRAPVNPLVQPKRRPARPPTGRTAPAKGQEEAAAPRKAGGPKYRQVPQLETNQPQALSVQLEADIKPSGFSSDAVDAKVQDYPLVITKGAFKEGIRRHVAKFFSQKTIDPRNENEFTRPVRLQRRDARASPPGVKDGEADSQNGDAEDRARRDLERQERTARREIELSQIAPSANPTAPKRPSNKQKKIQEVLRHDHTEEQKAATQLRYEEALQWHLEDFDNKHSWVGGYESALSNTYAQLVFKDGKFNLTPLEKWYKFIPKMHVRQMQLEEAEQRLEQDAKIKTEPEWLVERKAEERRRRMEEEANKRATSRLWVGSALAERKGKAMTSRVKEEMLDVNELDFEEDFADDEENPLWEGDQDDVKENEDRIKRDQLQANIFDMKDEKSYDQADELERRARQAEKEHGRRVKKALMKRERNRIYESDSENPFNSEQSDSTDSEAEREREEQAKKEAEEKANGSQAASGNNSKTNTPSNRSSKHPERSSLKRSGSAHASDLSGNESSRKKQKKVHSRLGTGANTPNGATPRSRSPAPTAASGALSDASVGGGAPRKPLMRTVSSGDVSRRRPGAAGSGSEGEGAGSGGEMSDGTRKKIKMLVKKTPASTNASPGGSRSPSPGRSTPRDGAGRPRAVSPDAMPIPTEAELRAAIPPQGITIMELTKKFGRDAIMGANKAEVFRRIKSISTFEKDTKKLLPKV